MISPKIMFAALSVATLAAIGHAQQQQPFTKPEVANVQVSGTLALPDGTPWTQGAYIEAYADASGYRALAPVPSSATGDFSLSLRLPAKNGDVLELVGLRVWAYSDPLDYSMRTRAFIDPERGRGSFIKPQKVNKSPSGALYLSEKHTLSLPPSYGTIFIANPAQQNCQMGVCDHVAGEEDALRSKTELALDLVRENPLIDLGTGNSTIELFRWSLAPGAHVFILGPAGSAVNRTILRRTAGIPLTINAEESVSVTVDPLGRPNSFMVMLVEPHLHAPDVNSIHGSARVFFEQLQKASVLSFTDALDANNMVTFSVPDADYVVELWEKSVHNGATIIRLSSSVAVTASQSNPSVVFN